MPKTDDGFQGWRPSDLSGYGAAWDAMTSPERRRAFVWELVTAAIGVLLVVLFSLWR